MVQLMKAHMQEENEQLILNDVGTTDVTNDDYDQIVQLPVNNQSRLIEQSLYIWKIKASIFFFSSKSKKKKKKQRRNNKENASSDEEEETAAAAAAPPEEEVVPEPTSTTDKKKKGKSTTEEVWIVLLRIPL